MVPPPAGARSECGKKPQIQKFFRKNSNKILKQKFGRKIAEHIFFQKNLNTNF
jgi:hypothetical protein